MRILQWNENVSGIAGMSVQHLSEIESSKRDPRLSSIERIADAMELAETSHDDPA
jgi:transcriptional regulator with XRE-family HTH domain